MFQDLLVKNEKVLWEGRAKAFNMLEGPYKASLMLRWIIWIVICFAATFGYAFYATTTEGSNFYPLMLIITIGVPFFFFIQPILDKKKIQREGCYAVTNLRVISCTGDRNIWSLPLAEAKNPKVEKMSSGAGVLYMGEAKNRRASASRTAALFGVKDDNNQVTGVVFYSVEDYEAVRKLLS